MNKRSNVETDKRTYIIDIDEYLINPLRCILTRFEETLRCFKDVRSVSLWRSCCLVIFFVVALFTGFLFICQHQKGSGDLSRPDRTVHLCIVRIRGNICLAYI